jgi:hypothetical protein
MSTTNPEYKDTIDMSGYILLKHSEIIEAGDEYRFNPNSKWTKQKGWTGKTVGSLVSQVGTPCQMRRKVKKKVIEKIRKYWK